MADIQKLYEQWLAKATADPDLKAELESIKDDEDGKNLLPACSSLTLTR